MRRGKTKAVEEAIANKHIEQPLLHPELTPNRKRAGVVEKGRRRNKKRTQKETPTKTKTATREVWVAMETHYLMSDAMKMD